ncbi:unnamed protein product [Rhizoctonia solani]|uniref:Uncharacterized protein n=1 Tax=Rhizoctonia solani TaxID=456999 RepID=A0A8H3HII3_9AGAM|nr:unnamed protein product [Rhizoctonia solani]
MDVDSFLSAPIPFDGFVQCDKENAGLDTASDTLAPTSPVGMVTVLTPALLNRGPDSPSQPYKVAQGDMSLDGEKPAAMIRTERKIAEFAGGARRESFPGRHLHTPDVSFNCEEVFLGDKSYSSDATHEGMSFVYSARSSTPVSAHEVRLPSTVQRTASDQGAVVGSSSSASESGMKAPLPAPTSLEGLDGLPSMAPKPRTATPRSPLAFEVDTDTEGKSRAPSKSMPGSEPDPGREFEFVPPHRNNSSERAQVESGPVPPVAGLKPISARAAALRFILPDDSLMEMDSILDVQFPGGMEDEFTAAFARLALGSSNSKPEATKSQSATLGPIGAHQERELADSARQESLTTVERDSQGEVGSTESNPAPGRTNGLYLEDEHTLNITSLGLSGLGNTLLMDMSLDQLRSKPNEVEHGNATFGGSSFAIAGSSATECSTGAMLEAQTPKRTASNSLPHVDDGEVCIEATVRKPRSTNGRMVSDAVVDALRSGRALHRATHSITGTSDVIGPTDKMYGTDERPIGKQMWPGSTASLRRTGSFTTSNTAESRQYPGSAIPLQRTRSTLSLRRTSSATSYQPDFMRPHSRTSVVDVDSEDDQPYTPSLPTVSRGSSRRSSVYALPQPDLLNDLPAPYFERPSSVASVHDRPTSAASMRPTSAASIRPTSAASIRTSSTRPTSVASSLRSGSAASSRRVSGAHLRTSSTTEDELVKGMEALMGDMRKASPTSTTRHAQEIKNVRSTKIGVESGDTKDKRDVTRSGIRQPLGSSTPRLAGSGPGPQSGIGPPKTAGSKVLLGMPGSKYPIGPGARSTAAGSSGASKTMSAASGRSAPMTAGSGTRFTTSTLRSQSSTVRLRASTLGLFAPDGGPGAGQEPKKLTHKASSASVSVTPSTTRSLRAPTTTSSIRTLSARGVGTTTAPTRAAVPAGSIASLREAMRSKGTSKR